MNKNRRYRDTVATMTLPDGTVKAKCLPSLKETGQMLLTFTLAVVGWIIFRAENIGQIGEIISTIISVSILSVPMLISYYYYISLFMAIIVMLLFEWFTRDRLHGLEITNIPYRWIRWSIYLLILLVLFFAIKTETPQFIYFQF